MAANLDASKRHVRLKAIFDGELGRNEIFVF